MGFDRLEIDQQTGEVYVLDDHRSVWKIGDWKDPAFVKIPLLTASIAIDGATGRSTRARWPTTARPTPSASWPGFTWIGPIIRRPISAIRSRIAAPRSSTTSGASPATATGDLPSLRTATWPSWGIPKTGCECSRAAKRKCPGKRPRSRPCPNLPGAARFDLQGNLYVGYADSKPTSTLPGFGDDRFAQCLGRIHKFAPTGSLAGGNLFPQAPAGPARTYDVPYGAFDADCIVRTPRFGVDGFGRIYYPTNIAQRVAVMDNAGNEILSFGTYGNRDSLGGLPGDRVPTPGIPLAFPNSVDATDDFIYVGDMVNLRLLRIRKTFQQEAASR